MSRTQRRDRAHIELVRHNPVDGAGGVECGQGCGEWSLSHVADMAALAVSDVIVAELKIARMRDAAEVVQKESR